MWPCHERNSNELLLDVGALENSVRFQSKRIKYLSVIKRMVPAVKSDRISHSEAVLVTVNSLQPRDLAGDL